MHSRSDNEHYRTHVHQAAAVVAAQLGCDIDGALTKMKTVAIAAEVTIDELARDVLDGAVRFDV